LATIEFNYSVRVYVIQQQSLSLSSECWRC
jgi:hypothetical protein